MFFLKLAGLNILACLLVIYCAFKEDFGDS